MLSDMQGNGEVPADNGPVDSPELPQEDGWLEGDSPYPQGQDGVLYDVLLDPLADVDPLPPRRGRKWSFVAAPALLLIPLVLLSLVIYLFQPSWLQRPTPEAQLEPTGTISATASPLPSSTMEEAPNVPVSTADESDDLLAQAEDLVWQSEFDQAIAIFEELVRQSPDDARPETGWARALLLDGLLDEALGHAQQAVALDPNSAEAATILAQIYLGEGDKARGLSTALRALGLDPGNADAHAVLAEAYLVQGQLDKALEEATLALNQDGASAEAHRIRALLYETVDNDLEAALRELELSAELQPGLWLRHYDLGLLRLKAEEYDAAIDALTEAWVLRRALSTYSALGQAYYRLGQYDQAASYLEQALSAGAWNADTYALLSSISAHRDRCSDAETYAKQALEQDPNNPVALQAREDCRAGTAEQTSTATPPAVGQGQSEVATPVPVPAGLIAFPLWNAEMGQYDTYVAREDGSERGLVVEGMHQPSFSPDGQWLAVNGERQDHLNLFVVRPNGSDLLEITDHTEDGLPAWSPVPVGIDATELSLAFSSTRHGDKQSRIYILDQVTMDGQKAEARALNSGWDDVRGEYPAWLVDSGAAGVVYSGCYYDAESAQCGLILVSADPGPQTPRPLTTQPEDTAPAVRGSRIAFMSNRDGNWEIYLVQSDGSGLKRLTHNTAIDGLPVWSPDGGRIAFVSDEGGTWAVWVVRPDGSERRRLFELGTPGLASEWQHERISWGPDAGLFPAPVSDGS